MKSKMGNTPNGPQNGQPHQPQGQQPQGQQPQGPQRANQQGPPQQQHGHGYFEVPFEVLQHAKAEEQKYKLKVAQEKAKTAAKLAEVEYQNKQLDRELLDHQLKHQEQMAELPHRGVLQTNQHVLQLIEAARNKGRSEEEISMLVKAFQTQAQACGSGWQQQQGKRLQH